MGKKWETSGMTTAEWEKAREHGPEGDLDYCLGGSDMGTVLGLSHFSNPRQLYMEKKGLIEKPVRTAQEQLRLDIGHDAEDQIGRLFERETGYKVYNDTFMYQHETYPWALANIDRRFDTPEEKGLILEIKTVSFGGKDAWADGAVPPNYEAQVRFYMAVLNVEKAAIIGCWGFGSNDHSIVFLPRDRKYEERMFSKANAFIEALQNGEIPDPGIDPVKERDLTYQFYSGYAEDESVELDSAEYAPVFKRYLEIEAELKEAKAAVKALENQQAYQQTLLLDGLAGNLRATCKDATVSYSLSLKPMAPVRLDTTRLKEERPDIIEEYSRPVPQSPRWTVRKK